jgi:hypothetical protein
MVDKKLKDSLLNIYSNEIKNHVLNIENVYENVPDQL